MIYVPIKARTMLSSHSKPMVSNTDRGLNNGAYRRCLSRTQVNYYLAALPSDAKAEPIMTIPAPI